ncbi:hypothetical protein [Candidatus Chlamydia sanziniae]|uniref:Uncharacterized protein n=1 Tax=Candidatus Chlamydia sanziniae TaxID=1806891 RepID=A0A1A9HUS1_9CHLA|nr:hypothetical protein [Candidatus Chlamydia sanziniae]ANH78738.1 hypothetical protein Cs308_0568 [Candidatus Chlamydia sanziniae]
MRAILFLLSLLLILPAVGNGEDDVSTFENQNQEEKHEDQQKAVSSSMYDSYLEGLTAARQENKPLVFVVLNNQLQSDSTVGTCNICSLLAASLQASYLGDIASIVVLCFPEASHPVYPPMPNSVHERITEFKNYFPDTQFPEGMCVVVIGLDEDEFGKKYEEIWEITPIGSEFMKEYCLVSDFENKNAVCLN